MTEDRSFIPQVSNYRDLIVFQKAECIYDVTFHFAHRFLDKGDRTIDQMIQAARSGKQNIAEGRSAAPTSRETEIKLFNVAKASLQELLIDYEDYLRVRGLCQWQMTDPRCEKARRVCWRHNDSEFYRRQLPDRGDEAIANIAMTLINQTNKMLFELIEVVKDNFKKHGGIREEMSRARRDYRDEHYNH